MNHHLRIACTGWVTLTLLGACCAIASWEDVADLDRLCDELGLDTIETGAALAVAYQRTQSLAGVSTGIYNRADHASGLMIGTLYSAGTRTGIWMDSAMIAHESRFAAPTIELTIHFRTGLDPAFTAPGEWCHSVFRSPVVSEGFVDETGEIWSHDGRLLVQSRQLSLLIPLPEMPARPEMEWIDP